MPMDFSLTPSIRLLSCCAARASSLVMLPSPHLAALLQAFSQATKVLAAWVVAPAGWRLVTFFVGPHSAVVSRCDDGGLYADEATGTFCADVADDAWVGLAVRVVDAVEYPSLAGDSWRLLATSEEVCEVLAGVEFTDLYPDEVPLLAGADGEFWAVAAPSSPGCSGTISRMFCPSRPTPEPQVSQSENIG